MAEHVYILYRSGKKFLLFFGKELGLPEVCDVLVGEVAELGAQLVKLCELVL